MRFSQLLYKGSCMLTVKLLHFFKHSANFNETAYGNCQNDFHVK